MIPHQSADLYTARVKQGYSLNPSKNASITSEDTSLSKVWSWLALYPNEVPKCLMSLVQANSSSKATPPHTLHSSPWRSQALYMCGWGDIDQKGLDLVCRDLESIRNYSKAAMISLMFFNKERALKALNYMGSEASALVSILQKVGLDEWVGKMKSLGSILAEQTSNTYLEASIRFLIGKEEYESILKALSIPDKIGFACRFLSDSELQQFIQKEIEVAKHSGNIEALLITGNSPESIEILTKFVEKSQDIQSAALLSMYLQLETPPFILNQYRYFLNNSQLWEARCKLDIEENEMGNQKRDKGKAMRCYYCGSSLALQDLMSALTINRRGMSQFSSNPTTKSCPECLKNLPRCAICLIPYASINPYFEMSRSFRTAKSVAPSMKFEEWFTWCEKCHHGGHSSHILEWFEETKQCPVSGCNCECLSLDVT